MGIAALKLKIMPESPEINLEKLKKKTEVALKKAGAKRIEKIEEEPIAFGLKALVVTIAWPEEKDTSKLENLKIEDASSIQIIDYRRAFG